MRGIIVIMVILAIILVSGCEEQAENTQIANPASVHCIEQGGTLEMRQNELGQHGMCIFDDGSECEEWAFFRGECNIGSNFNCTRQCGDGKCNGEDCDGQICQCPETDENCPQDCFDPDEGDENPGNMPDEFDCVDLCGDSICQEVVCLAEGCPCEETKYTCPEDCS